MRKTTNPFKDRTILVLGYAMTGKSVADYLIDQGANVIINDRGDLEKDPSVALFVQKGAKIVGGGHPVTLLDNNLAMIIKNPGIPYQIPLLQEAQRREIPIYTDVELASWIENVEIIGVTGSNGKTTTTKLIHNLLTQGLMSPVHLAGNIGVPTLDVVRNANINDTVVMELSSFQLMGTHYIHPHIAVMTNIYPSHLDYHSNLEEYIQAKLKLLANQTNQDYIIYRYDNGELHNRISPLTSQKVPFTQDEEFINDYVRGHGAYVQDGMLMFKGEAICPVDAIAIPGDHNIENVLAAMAVAKLKGVKNDQIEAVIRQYHGMAHRIQPIGESQGRKFFNDSKATNVTATITALKSFTEPIRYIGGGLDRGNNFEGLSSYLNQVQAAYLYGETAEKMANDFKEAGVANIYIYETLEKATRHAYQEAEVGEVILFSPACASWDQFNNFEERGEAFMHYIEQLLQEQPYKLDKGVV